MTTVLARSVPALAWLRAYDRSWLRPDIIAGLTAGGVVIPQAMAYATVAGLPVQVGLMTCIVPMAVYALLGGSRKMSLSTTSTIVALTATALAAVGPAATKSPTTTAATLTLLVGLALIGMRILRLGFLVESVSELVLIGLKVGVGLTISVSQLPKVLGLTTSADGFVDGIRNVLDHLSDISLVTTCLSAVTIALVLVLRRVAPRVPGPLVALALGIGLVWLADLDDHGVALIPHVPRGLVAPALPSTDNLGTLAPYALAIALMALLESISVARATREPDDPPLRNNQEIVAVGAASVAGAFFLTVPAAGGFSQTLVNAAAGARTQLSELVTAALAILTALFLAPVLSDLPEATLGSVVLVAVSSLVSLKDLKRVARVDHTELALAVATAVIALFTNLLVGVIVGVALTYLLGAARPEPPGDRRGARAGQGRRGAAGHRPRRPALGRAARVVGAADRGRHVHGQHPGDRADLAGPDRGPRAHAGSARRRRPGHEGHVVLRDGGLRLDQRPPGPARHRPLDRRPPGPGAGQGPADAGLVDLGRGRQVARDGRAGLRGLPAPRDRPPRSALEAGATSAGLRAPAMPPTCRC